jgi:L-threonine kinase
MSAVGATGTGTPLAAPTGVGSAFGTFGELLQGTLPEQDGDFLVTLPIARWAVATFHGDPHARELEVVPRHKVKALRLARMILAWRGLRLGGRLSIESGLPEGKGMASSSADLVATARALSSGLAIDLSTRRLESMLARIEPTDGVLYPGVVAYHHRSVRLRANLGSLAPLTIVSVDEGDTVDTVAFNRIPKPFSAAQRQEYAELLDQLAAALADGNPGAVGAIATRSAVLNQTLNPKRTLDEVLRINDRFGGLGVVNAHSGTTLGVLLDPSEPDRVAAVASEADQVAAGVSVHRSLSFDTGPGARLPRWV